ncbi:MAG TPA: SHOCT domain-containing protein [Thermohalobaculum sp.]|nr:SHOCT domain-containing protein [Thermohalobaculum sp.]
MTGLRKLPVLAATVVLAALPTLALAQGAPGYYADHMWGGGWHGWFFGPLMMVFWLVILVGAVILIARWLGASGHIESRRKAPGSDALDILRERFAKGEIDKAEFEERRALLGS